MKIKVTEVTKEELVNLFSTATYGSEWLEINTLKSEKYLDDKFSSEYLEDRCREEKWADRLLSGGHVVFIDNYEEESYKRTLEEVLNGIALSLEHSSDWYDVQEGEGDIFNASNVVQFIMFGELVYG